LEDATSEPAYRPERSLEAVYSDRGASYRAKTTRSPRANGIASASKFPLTGGKAAGLGVCPDTLASRKHNNLARFLRNRCPFVKGTLTNPALKRLLPCNRHAMSLGLWLFLPLTSKDETPCNAYSNGIQTKA
jgi:hypothetical protein